MKQSEPRSVVEEYDRQRDLYLNYASTLYSLIRDLLDAESFRPHSVQQRVKGRTSLARKVLSDLKYAVLADVPDVVGIRIITYFADEVDLAANIIRREFEIVEVTDKRAEHGPGRFGYRSLHLVVKLKPPRLDLPEYRKFGNLRVEIQIRSILDHAWAEIEHDRGYKGSLFLPEPIQQHFSELSALLQNADRQFEEVRDELQQHARTVAWRTVRAEGLTELISDIALSINTHQIPEASRSAAWDMMLILNTHVANRPDVERFTDVVAFLDGADFSTSRGRLDAGTNTLKFAGLLQPETLHRGLCHVRIRNVRVGASHLVPPSKIFGAIQAWSCKTGEKVTLSDPFEIADTCSAFSFRACGHNTDGMPLVLSRAAGINSELAANVGAKSAIVNLELCFRESFAGAFRTDLQEAGAYGSEEVDCGTRFIVRFSPLHKKVQVYVTTRDLPGEATSERSRCKARLVDVEYGLLGSGAAVPAKAVANASLKSTQEVVPIARLSSQEIAVWEWVDGNPRRTTPEEVRFGIVVASKAGDAGLGAVGACGTIAPTSAIMGASRYGPIPRFTDATSFIEIVLFVD